MKKIFFVMGALLSGLGFLLSGCGGTFGNPSQKITIANAGAYAIYFPATNFQDIVISNPESMNDSEFTIEAYIKVPPAGGGGTIFMRGNSNSNIILYVDTADNFVKFAVDGQILSSDVDVSDGEWYHVAGVLASLVNNPHNHGGCSDTQTHTDIYVEGVWKNCLDVSPPADIDGCTNSEGQAMKCPLIIGRDLTAGIPLFTGTIDEVRLWKEARDKSVFLFDPGTDTNFIFKWMDREISGDDWADADPDTKIAGYWKFNEGTGTTVTDASGYGHAGAKLQCVENCGSGNPAFPETSTPWETGWVNGYPFLN